MDRYYAIVGNIALPMAGISDAEMARVRDASEHLPSLGVPMYFSPTLGVWPEPGRGIKVAKEAD